MKKIFVLFAFPIFIFLFPTDATFKIDVTNSSAINLPNAPKAIFHKITEEHNVRVGGEKGIKIHLNMNVNNIKGQSCWVHIWFYSESGKPLKDKNGKYKNSTGCVIVSKKIKPGHKLSWYKDLVLFMPYSELHINGKHQVKFLVGVYYKSKPIGLSKFNKFDLKWGSKPPYKVKLLKGDTKAKWGAKDCNTCVNNVPAELDRIRNNYKSAGRIRFDGYAYPTSGYLLHRINKGHYEHIQSIGRIAGLGNNEYMVFTHSTASAQRNKQGALAVIRMGAKQNTKGNPFYSMPDKDGSNQKTSNRTVARTYTKNNHPGGLSVLGHYVYVAQWCQDKGNKGDWCKESSKNCHGMGFSVYDVRKVHRNSKINSNPPDHCSYRHVYGEDWIGSSSTASIAAVKLYNGKYLVVLGKSGGKKYGFYTADSPAGPFEFHNASNIGYYGENATIVTDCRTGDLYMFQIEGYGNQDNSDRVHLYKLVLKNRDITFRHVKSRTFRCRGSNVNGARDWCHFDAGAGFYVTPKGKLVLYATDWQQSSHGNIRLVEFY